MKRYAYYLLIMAAAAMVACQAEPVNYTDPEVPEVPELQNGTYIYTINASIPEEESTPEQVAVKSNYDAGGNFSWSEGDAISVLFHDASKEDSDPEKNKFFTLTLTSGAGKKAASFSGAITSGYTIGASDGDALDKKIWALFPASTNHTYSAGNLPSFYVQPSVDFTATHFSANVPMYALNTEEGALSFANLASTYKFIVTGIKDGVSKVEFSIFNQLTRGLSGLWTIEGDPSDLYINYEYASPGSANSTLTYISDVTSNQAVFYASCRYWGDFKPSITVTNIATGTPIKSFVASKVIAPTSKSVIKPITLDVSEANGGVYYTPAITIDGNLSDWAGISAFASTDVSRLREWKIETDDYFVYFYAAIRKNRAHSANSLYIGFDTDNDNSTGNSYGDVTGCEAYVKVVPFTNVGEATTPVGVDGVDAASEVWANGVYHNGTVLTWSYDADEPIGSNSSNVYLELKISRDYLNMPAAGNTIKVGCSYGWYETQKEEVILK